MAEINSDVSVVDVYDMASEIGKEFEKLIDANGPEMVSHVLPKVITVLENLESLAIKNERENTVVHDLMSKITRLEMEKIEKAEDRQRFEAVSFSSFNLKIIENSFQELEQIEEHWREESKELLSLVSRLQEENRKLIVAAERQKAPDDCASPVQDVDMTMVHRLRNMVDKQRDQIRAKDKELAIKISELETVSSWTLVIDS